MPGLRTSAVIALGLAVGLGLDVVRTQTAPAPELTGRWRLVSVNTPPATATELTVSAIAPGVLSIERGYATELVTELYRVDAPPRGAEFEAKRVGSALVLVIPGQISRGAAPSTPNREEVWSITVANELTIDLTDQFGSGPLARSRLTYRRVEPSARPGENLVANPDAGRGRAGWKFFGDAKVEACDGDPCFVIRNQGIISQTVLLPEFVEGTCLVVIGSGTSERAEVTITGKPSLSGQFAIADGSRLLGYLSGQQMLGQPPVPNRWVTMWGVFPLPNGAGRVSLHLMPAEARGFPQNGSATRFDDLGIHLFPSETEARVFVDRWKGRAGGR